MIRFQGIFSLFVESSSSSSSDKSRNLKGTISKYLCGVKSHTQVNEWTSKGKIRTDTSGGSRILQTWLCLPQSWGTSLKFWPFSPQTAWHWKKNNRRRERGVPSSLGPPLGSVTDKHSSFSVFKFKPNLPNYSSVEMSVVPKEAT